MCGCCSRSPTRDPKILIVTDKLLTGYDAPLLYCLYLDKPMRDHVLLQAIARVNRPYVDAQGVQKRVGLVVDFVGVLRELKKALQFDSEDVERRDRGPRPPAATTSSQKIAQAEGRLSRCRRRRRRRRAAGARSSMAASSSPKPRKAFFEAYKDIENLWEILSPSPELRRPHRHLQAAGAALRRGAQRLCRQGRLRRRSRLQDAPADRAERHAGADSAA